MTSLATKTLETNRPTKRRLIHITEYTNGNTTNKIKRKLKTILKKHMITADEQLIACKEDLNQTLQAKAQ